MTSKPEDEGEARSEVSELRLISYLSPSLPEALFEHVARHLGAELPVSVHLDFERRWSGPAPGQSDALLDGKAHVGFVCAPTLARLAQAGNESLIALGVGPVFDDPRNSGRPVYFTDLLVRADEPVTGLEELSGRIFGYNDARSWSGHGAIHTALSASGRDFGLFGETVVTGSHLRSLKALREGQIDACAIDGNVLGVLRRTDPLALNTLRVVTSWGPHPIQPVVVRRDLPQSMQDELRKALLSLPRHALGLRGFAEVDVADYASERWPEL